MWWWSSPTADNTLITPLPKTYFIALHNNNWSDCILCFNTVCPISGFLRGSMKFYFFFSFGGAGVLQVNPTHTSLPLRSKIITRFFDNSISIYPGERTWLTLFRSQFSLTPTLFLLLALPWGFLSQPLMSLLITLLGPRNRTDILLLHIKEAFWLGVDFIQRLWFHT